MQDIIIIQLARMGDIIQTIPLINDLKTVYPQTNISLIINEVFKECQLFFSDISVISFYLENLNDNRFLENVKSIKYLETPNYRNLIRFISSADYQVFVFGHSCGISDRTLLNTLFEHDNCKSIKIFYHERDDATDDFSDVLMNVSRCFNNSIQSKAKLRERVVNKKFCKPLFSNKDKHN